MLTGTSSFLNKNIYRQFPLKTTDASYLPSFLISDFRISIVASDDQLFVSKFFKSGSFICLDIKSNLSNSVIGSFNAILTQDYQKVELTSASDTSSGHAVFGTLNEIMANIADGVYLYQPSMTSIEESCVFVYTRPDVTRLSNRQSSVYGLVSINLDNLSDISILPDVFEFDILLPDLTTAINGPSMSQNNCGLPGIQSINDVTPNIDGNIDIYTILPLSLSIGAGELNFSSVGFTIDDYCKYNQKNIPPTDNSDTYVDASGNEPIPPSYLTWPQYA